MPSRASVVRGVMVGWVLLAPATLALGQTGGASKAPELRPPVLPPPKEDQSLSFGPMVGALLAGGLAVAVTFIPVKRGKHQD